MAIKGYVVRYTNDRGTFYVTAPKWLDDFTIGSRADEGSLFETLGGATAAARHPRRVADVAIFRVLDDGREERLPSYEEALAGLQTVSDVLAVFGVPDDGTGLPQRLQLLHEGAHDDPIAALEAAERRLLESARWTPGDRGFWVDPDDGTQWPREGAISDVRRRLAAKGGA